MLAGDIKPMVHTLFGAAISVILSSSLLRDLTVWWSSGQPIAAFLTLVIVGVFCEFLWAAIETRRPFLQILSIIFLSILAFVFTQSKGLDVFNDGAIQFKPDPIGFLGGALMLFWAATMGMLSFWLRGK